MIKSDTNTKQTVTLSELIDALYQLQLDSIADNTEQDFTIETYMYSGKRTIKITEQIEANTEVTSNG